MGDEGESAPLARMREVAQSQVIWLVTLVVTIGSTASGFGIWLHSLQSGLNQQAALLERVVAFMDEQTRARRASGARERQRKELCQVGVLVNERCLFLPSETELQAMER